MISKKTIAHIILLALVCYTISPWFFEKKLLFNELLAIAGLGMLAYHGYKTGRDPISICMIFLISWGFVQLFISLFIADNIYYLLRNSVIVYSMFGFFLGYFLFSYLPGFIARFRKFLRWYIGLFLLIPLPKILFERFGMATLFPALFKSANKWTLPVLIFICIVYGISYDSATAFLIAALYLLLLISPGYRFFKQVSLLALVVFAIFFISVQPNLNIIKEHYTPDSDRAIHEVMDSHPVLSLDGNSTWRLVLWKQVLVDHFPFNIAGIGMGTPMFKYFPVEDYSKLPSLPYILGAHNSFVYLFGRLGFPYLILIALIYIAITKEYFHHKSYYYRNNSILIFWSFFAFTMIALFNPALESPIYASGYWISLGFTAKAISNRRFSLTKIQHD